MKLYFEIYVACVALFLLQGHLKAQTDPAAGANERVIQDQVQQADSLVQKQSIPDIEMKESPDIGIVTDSIKPEMNNNKSKALIRLFYRDSTKNLTAEQIAALYAGTAIHEGKTIRTISVRRVDVFAPAIVDTGYVPSSWIERTGNKLHSDTRVKIIRRNLLVSPGEKVDAFLLRENERMIRNLPYIMDARFLIRTIYGSSDSVDLELLIKDLWPVGFGGEISDFDEGNISIWHLNILGSGHQFQSSVYWDANMKPLLGYDLFYGIANISGTFISSQIEYVHKWHTESYWVNVFRNFQSSGLKYAGAAIFENTKTQKDIELIDTTLAQVDLQYRSTDIWAGRMFSLPHLRNDDMHSNIYLSGRAAYIKFQKGPETGETYLYDYQNKTQLLFSLAYSLQGFRKDNHIYTFDRTEDVPFGILFEVTSGAEWGQHKTRPYIAGSLSAGKDLPHFGYLYGMVQYGTFINQGVSEQGMLHVRFRYFTDLLKSKRFDVRGFATLTYQHVMNMYSGEFISVENKNGIAGLNSLSMRGDEKVVLNFESVLFSPYRLLGFRFVFFASADFGLIWENDTDITGRNFFNGIGLGVRIRNDMLVFNTLEIKFSFYPKLPEDASATYFDIGGVPSLRLNDFYANKPTILKY